MRQNLNHTDRVIWACRPENLAKHVQELEKLTGARFQGPHLDTRHVGYGRQLGPAGGGGAQGDVDRCPAVGAGGAGAGRRGPAVGALVLGPGVGHLRPTRVPCTWTGCRRGPAP